MEHANRFLETEGLGRLMRKYALPCVISLLVAALYNIVGQLFIANASYLGSYGNAANTVVYPLTVVALAIAVLIGDGCCAYVSLCQGRREEESARRSVGSAVFLSVAAGVMLMAVYLLYSRNILTMFGGTVNEETYRQSQEYFFWITLGIPFYVFGQAINPVIRADGSPRYAMMATLAGAAVNIVLDPVFIFLFRWGMMGAAVATVLGQMLTAALSVVYLVRMKTMTLTACSLVPDWRCTKRMIPLGVCSFLSQISLVAAMAAINNMLRQSGTRLQFFQIVISIVVGMAAGCIPVVGFNMGAGRKDRALALFRMLLLLEACVGLVALLIVELFPRQLIGLFGAGNESEYYTLFAVRAFRVYLCLLPMACVNKATFIYLQALGRALASTLLSMVREIVFGVGFALLLPVFFGLDDVLYSMPLSDGLTSLIAAALIVQTSRLLRTVRH